MNLQETFFNVGLVTVPHPATEKDSKYRYVMNHNTDEILSIVTKDYTLVPNADLVGAMLSAINGLHGELIECKLFGSGARTQYRYRFPFQVMINKDEMFPEVVIRNSYDGSIAITVMAGTFREVCTNGMVIGKIVDYFKSRHLTDVNINKLGEILTTTIEKTIKYLSQDIAQLVNVSPVKEKHIVELISLFPDRMMERTMEMIVKNKPKNYWDLLNIATTITTHKMNRDAESTHNFEKKLLPAVMKMVGLK